MNEIFWHKKEQNSPPPLVFVPPRVTCAHTFLSVVTFSCSKPWSLYHEYTVTLYILLKTGFLHFKCYFLISWNTYRVCSQNFNTDYSLSRNACAYPLYWQGEVALDDGANGAHACQLPPRRSNDSIASWVSACHGSSKTGWVTFNMIPIFWISLLLVMKHWSISTILKRNVKVRSGNLLCLFTTIMRPLTRRPQPPRIWLNLTW